MTEVEWLATTDLESMLEFLRDKTSDRKLRLLLCAYFRNIYPTTDRRNTVISIGERCADQQASADEIEQAISVVTSTDSSHSVRVVVSSDISSLAYSVIHYEFVCCLPPEQRKELCKPIRDIFGSLPFRPVFIDSNWLTSTVVQLAESIYSEKAFAGLPILADALQEAGCESDDILNHLRSSGPHVRGCWALDLILGKK